MSERKILWGVCGIGNGHMIRQLPLIEHFSRTERIVIFAYDASYRFYAKRFEGHPRVTVLPVAVPFYVGDRNGIDLEATKRLPANDKDYDGINGKARQEAEALIGTPDLVISDYEPTCAAYAYEHGVPLVTIDQQSKYLCGDFPQELHGQTYADEVARLRLFFPQAAARIACSFFAVAQKAGGETVKILPPIIRDTVLAMKNEPSTPPEFLVYLSAQQAFGQSLEEVISICASFSSVRFHIFAAGASASAGNVATYPHGDPRFDQLLQRVSGVICTAGHTLLSEAIHLGIPVYAMPLAVYEQQMNAEIIGNNDFGVRAPGLDQERLAAFVREGERFRENIRTDARVLLRGDGAQEVIRYLEQEHLKG